MGSTVVTVKATDQDTGRNAEVEYSIVSVTAGGTTTHTEDAATFRIDSRSVDVQISDIIFIHIEDLTIKFLISSSLKFNFVQVSSRQNKII